VTPPREPRTEALAPAAVAPWVAWLTGPLLLRHRVAVGLAGLATLSAIYSVVGFSTAGRGGPYLELSTPIDEAAPFTLPAVLVYGFIYSHALIPLALVEDRRLLARAVAAYLGCVLVSVPVWLTWPVSVPREALPVTDTLSWGLTVIRAFDPPTNCFPSMHVAETSLAALLVLRMDRPLGRAMLVSAALIWWSTVALDQHWFLDGLAGVALALAADRLAFAGAAPDALRAGPRSRVGWMMAFYLFLFCLFAAPWWLGVADLAWVQPTW